MGRKGKAPSAAAAARQGAAARRRGAASDAGGPRRTRRGGENDSTDAEDFEALVQQVAPLGLVVKKMDTDGNCLFRAFADQVLGDSEEHAEFRARCCDHMLSHSDDFVAFHADEDFVEEEGFEAYVERMRSPGVWGSQLELMALCQAEGVNAIVHQAGMPAYEMVFAPEGARCVQLAYHDGEHYNSVRLLADSASGDPARCLSLKQLRGERADAGEGEDLERLRELLPPERDDSAAALRRALAGAGGDVEAAAEALLGGVAAGAEGQAAAAPDAGAEEVVAEVAAPSLHADGREEKRAGKASKAERAKRKGKQAAEERRSAGPKHSADACDFESRGGAPDSEALALLAKQLIPV